MKSGARKCRKKILNAENAEVSPSSQRKSTTTKRANWLPRGAGKVDRIRPMAQSRGLPIDCLGSGIEKRVADRDGDRAGSAFVGAVGARGGRLADDRPNGRRRYDFGELGEGLEEQPARGVGAGGVQRTGVASAGWTVCGDAGPRALLLFQRAGDADQ